MKSTDESAKKTPDLLKRPPGRPSTGKAMTGAERIKRLRSERKANGLCQCCGQLLPLDV